MSETKNYKLYVTDDRNEFFKDWSTNLAGETDSNMTKIDEILAAKADGSRQVITSLLSAGWSGEAAPYTQTLSVEGLGADQNGSIALTQTATQEERRMARAAMLSISDQSEGQLVITADGERPTADIPVCVTLIG